MTHKTLIETDHNGRISREIRTGFRLKDIDSKPVFVFNSVNNSDSLLIKDTHYTDYTRMALCENSLSFRLFKKSRLFSNHDEIAFDIDNINEIDEPMPELWRIDLDALLQNRRGGNDMSLHVFGLTTNESLWKFSKALDKTCYNSEKAIDMYMFLTL